MSTPTTWEGGDCGDPKAWTSGPACCSLHTPGEQSRSAKQNLATMPPDLMDRSTHVVFHMVRYALDVFTNPKAVGNLVSSVKEKKLFSYYCVLMNDKSHSYEAVLEQVLPKPGAQLARDLNTYVNKCNKDVTRVGNCKDCVTAISNIEARTAIRSGLLLLLLLLVKFLLQGEGGLR